MTEFHQYIESVLGQFCYAFGAGAGRLRVESAAIKALQARYRPYLTANLETAEGRHGWQQSKYHLLDYVTAMGRYAASLALEAGDATILAEHFETAAHRFEAAAHRTKVRALTAGMWCPGGPWPSPDRPGSPQPEAKFRSGPRAQLGA
jgi:hypothetical protein